MLFNSLEYIVFLIVVVAVFFATTSYFRYRWLVLLVASYWFYMSWQPFYILLITFTTIVTYSTVLLSEKSNDQKIKRYLLWLSVSANLSILFFFKYFNFVNDSLKEGLSAIGLGYDFGGLDVLLPVGISFYTFQTLSYSIDHYYGNIRAERHLGIFALYVSYFPQLVAGPIERSGDLLPQFKKAHSFDWERIAMGSRRILWGLFKKMVIADNLGLLVDPVYNNPTEHAGSVLMLTTFLFAFQLYCDFSAYTDIAIGSARLMGVKLSENFNFPFISKNVTDFWRRWHITLSTWLRDYVYMPIMFGRREWGKFAVIYAIFITFFIAGLWHGARWTYVLFGVLQGSALVIEALSSKQRKKLAQGKYSSLYMNSSMVITFLFVLFSFIFFRANNTTDAFYIVSEIFSLSGGKEALLAFIQSVQLSKFLFIIAVLFAFILSEKYLFQLTTGKYTLGAFGNKLVYSLIAVAVLVFGYWGETEFVYFQF